MFTYKNNENEEFEKGFAKEYIKDVLFWSDKFYEHFHFIGIFIEKYNEKLKNGTRSNVQYLLDDVYFYEKLWKQMYLHFKNHSMGKAMKNLHNFLIPKTFRLYKAIENAFRASHIPCIPSLIEHMAEELEYFKNTILSGRGDLLSEISWWTKEHAENVAFISCELPQMAKINLLQWSKIPEIFNMMMNNKKLENTFKELHQSSESLRSRSRSIFRPGQEEEKFDVLLEKEELYHKVIAAKIKHIKSIHMLVSKLSQLPIEEEDKFILKDLLRHESEEAIFAYDRIIKFYHNEYT